MPTLLNDDNENVPFIATNEFTDGEEVEFASKGRLADDRWGENRLQIDIRRLSNGEIRKMTVNRTSQKNLTPRYGPDTEIWIGHKARVTKTTLPIGGRWKPVAILYPTE